MLFHPLSYICLILYHLLNFMQSLLELFLQGLYEWFMNGMHLMVIVTAKIMGCGHTENHHTGLIYGIGMCTLC